VPPWRRVYEPRRVLLADRGDVGLGRGVLGLVALVEEQRDGDRGEDADDDDADEELDQGEALVLVLRHGLAHTSNHLSAPVRFGLRIVFYFRCRPGPTSAIQCGNRA